MFRTHNCGQLRISNVGETVTLAGWIQYNRNLGGLTFIDLRDRFGITQLALNMETNPELTAQANQFGREYVIQATGVVIERSSKNKNNPTGDIEINVTELVLLNKSEIPPFTIEENTDGGEELRMKYRYLDLRRKPLQNNLILRHQLLQATRRYMSDNEFLEIETPFLIKSTPEGARDYVVPSRLHENQFYALPQSPQLFKQILMVGGYDRYFQIVKCFRDEDLRADRQPEFTQLDLEMSFIEQEDILIYIEGLVQYLFKEVKDVNLPQIIRMSYNDAMANYGSDKPDLRFDLKINYLNNLIDSATEFAPFKETLELPNGKIAGINIPNGATMSRKQIDAYTDFVKEPHRGLKGLIWVKWNEDETITSSAAKFFDEVTLKSWLNHFGASKGDMLLIGSGPKSKIEKSLGDLRLKIADDLNLKDKNKFAPLWVTDFPMFEWDEDKQIFNFMHHPFTSPRKEDMDKLLSDKGNVYAYAYDFVINGSEVGGGSIRIHNADIQAKVFEALGMTDEEAKDKFGFLVEALSFGAPPHGGLAFGFDRLCTIMCGVDSIRDVMAFPKNNAARDLMLDAPGTIDAAQRKELGL
jgi:aspartyl-tRNA synthetase